MRLSWKKFMQTLGIHRKTPPARMFVSLNLSKGLHESSRVAGNGSARQKTRVIIQISLWTCIILIFLFLIVYTILLAYVDNKFRPNSLIDPPGVYRKVKIHRRPLPSQSVMIEPVGVDVWNSSALYEKDQSLPQCKWQSVLRILITSSPEHTEQRQQIRKTWCDPTSWTAAQHAWHCIFLVGRTNSKEVDDKLVKEKQQFQDILIGNYVDSYRNLTLKVMHGFNWSSHWCPSLYVMKTDDDCFVNVHLLHNFLMHHNQQSSGLYAGRLITDEEKLAVVRDTSRKWAVSPDVYSPSHYPPYSSGMGYILSSDVVKKLVTHSSKISPFANEDAYVGVVLSEAGISPTHSLRFVLSGHGLRVCNYQYVFLVHDVRPEMQPQLRKMAEKAETSCGSLDEINGWS